MAKLHKPKNYLISYHFFPHYRSGVIKSLSRSGNFLFLGDKSGVDGIKPFSFHGQSFENARCYYFGSVSLQPKTIIKSFLNYDVYIFIANPNHICTWISAFICRLRGKRVIFWGHGFFSPKKTLKNRIRSIFFRLANSFYTYGYRAKENAESLGFTTDNIYVGYNSLDYDSQLKYRQNIEPLTHDSVFLRIVCVSRLTKLCRYDLMLEACALAKARFDLDVFVDFVGTGPEIEALRSQAHVLSVPSAFHGAVYDEDILSRFFSKADVTVMPGKIGLTAMHSMMYGTPVISHDDFSRQMPEVEAIVPGYTGDFFRFEDVDHLAETLSRFKENYRDRDQIRENCFRMIDEIYNPRRQAEVMMKAIRGEPAEVGDDAFRLFEVDVV